LHAAGLDQPVVFMTAHETEGVEEQAMRAGAVGFLCKSFAAEAGFALATPCCSSHWVERKAGVV
jgi:FixJ family two-component response regulator